MRPVLQIFRNRSARLGRFLAIHHTAISAVVIILSIALMIWVILGMGETPMD